MSDESLQLHDNVEERRFEMRVDRAVAFLEYRRRGNVLHLMHTEVPSTLRGRGMGKRLAKAVLDKARAEGLSVIPNCPFVKDFLQKHPDYQSLVAVPRAPL
jgi:predicted GNAT family acetyltransferase